MGGVSATFGTLATVLFAISHVPMVVKALRTRDVRSYSLPNLVLVNVGNVLWTVYVLSLPLGPVWALHTLYLIAGATMLVMVLRRPRERGPAAVSSPPPPPSAPRRTRPSPARPRLP